MGKEAIIAQLDMQLKRIVLATVPFVAEIDLEHDQSDKESDQAPEKTRRTK